MVALVRGCDELAVKKKLSETVHENVPLPSPDTVTYTRSFAVARTVKVLRGIKILQVESSGPV